MPGLRKPAYAMALLLMVILTAALLWKLLTIEQRFKRAFAQALDRYQIRAALEDAHINIFGFSSQRLELACLRPPFYWMLVLDEFKAKPRMLSLRPMALRFNGQAQAYNGSLAAELALSPLSMGFSGNLKAIDLNLALHPQLNGLGITSGRATLVVHRFQGSRAAFEQAEGELALRDVTRIVHRSGTTLLLELPFQDLSLKLNFVMVFQEFRIEHLESFSSLGRMEGRGSVNFHHGASVNLRLECRDISPELKGFLLQKSGLWPAPDTSSFELIIQGPLKSPRIQVTPL